MIRSHKIRIYPNKSQEEILNKSCGTARFVYNWGLEKWKEKYSKGEKPNYYSLKKELYSVKKEQFPWMYGVTKCCIESGLTNLKNAFQMFFKKQSKYPKFHSKKNKNSFTISNDRFYCTEFYIKLPKIKQKIKMAEELRLMGKVLIGTVSKSANKWFISISVEIPDKISSRENQSVGIDLGINSAVTTSDGKKFEAPKPLKQYQLRLRRQSKSLSRKVKGSNNWKKQVTKLQNLHFKIANIRNDWTHKMTTYLTSKYNLICMENLNVAGMVKNHCLAKSLMDISFGEIKRQLSYKGTVSEVDRFFPSSKLCSNCGNKKEKLLLSERIYKCDVCGFEEDRDINAAINIGREGLSRSQVCGHGSSGFQEVENETTVEEAEINECSLVGIC